MRREQAEALLAGLALFGAFVALPALILSALIVTFAR